jgi:hypothetical protein
LLFFNSLPVQLVRKHFVDVAATQASHLLGITLRGCELSRPKSSAVALSVAKKFVKIDLMRPQIFGTVEIVRDLPRQVH